MPDFGKALKQLEIVAAVYDRRRSQTAATAPRFSLAEQLQFLKSRRTATILPPGAICSNALGSHYLIETVYPEDHFHGKVRLSRFSSSGLECLMMIMRAKGSVPHRDR